MVPTAIDAITARDTSRWGCLASPAIWMACSKPWSANTTPAGSAANTPCAPYGMNPPPAVKLDGWNARSTNTTTVSSGTVVFQITVTPLVSAIALTPTRLMTVNASMNRAAISRPEGVSVPSIRRMLTCDFTQEMWSTYDNVASTSIGAIVTACSHAIHPAVKPASGPNTNRGKRAVPPAAG